MKSIVLFLLATTTAFTAIAQDAFSNVSLKKANNRTVLHFTANKNINVSHYRVEASKDNREFTVIARIPSKVNSIHPTEYQYDLAGQGYIYYRVAKVAMDGSMPYSVVVTEPKQHRIEYEVSPQPTLVQKAQ